MKWWPRPLKKGDLIRVKIGSIYHYGIFVSEEEIIQFGPLPTAQSLRESQSFAVIASDIDAFCGGVIVEAAIPETAEERKRFSAGKTIRRARAALGETGYDLIHNNCEHFVYNCAYGIKRCTQAEEARLRWHNRPLLNVYILPVKDSPAVSTVYPREREREIAAASGEVQQQKYAAWCALREGLTHAFGVDMESLTLRKSPAGKWTCDKYMFSLSHTDGAVAVAISNAEVGVDLENVLAFSARHIEELPRLCHEALTARECTAATDVTAFLGLWTRKESLFKYIGTGTFHPQSLSAADARLRTVSFTEGAPMVLSVCGDRIDHLNIYLLGGERPCRIHTQNQEFDLT